jgi:amidase
MNEKSTPRISNEHVVYTADKNNKPVLRVKSGDSIIFECKDCFSQQIRKPEQLPANIDMNHINPVTGPVYVEGIAPGDTLEVHIQKITVADQGVTCVMPGYGLLHDEFSEPWTKITKVKDGVAHFSDKIKIPVKPFPGVLSVAPAEDPIPIVVAPHHFDCKEINEGTIVYLPTYVEGALFGVGDLHSVQGDGELSATAIETDGEIQVKVVVNKSKKIMTPHIETETHYMTTSLGENTDEAAREALRQMINWLMDEKGLTRNEAYTLCSITADMKVNQVAGLSMKFCGARIEIPKSIFK